MRTGFICAVLVVVSTAVEVSAQSLFDPGLAVVAKKVKQKYSLTAKQGPVMIKVASFTGKEGLAFANELATELREKHGIDAYTWQFRIHEPVARPSQAQLAAFKKRFEVKFPVRKPMHEAPENWVVLAGNFPSFTSRQATKHLKVVQKIDPESISDEVRARMYLAADGKRNAVAIHRLVESFRNIRTNGKRLPPPLGKATLTRNPMTKAARTSITKEDAELLRRLNDNEKYSVYKLDAPFTLMAASFTGVQSFTFKKGDASKTKFRKSKGLKIAGENACNLARLLREMGYEAFVFHGRFASMVFVGGYESRTDLRLPGDQQAIRKASWPGFELKAQLIQIPRRPGQRANRLRAN